jgi:hypothetical protein
VGALIGAVKGGVEQIDEKAATAESELKGADGQGGGGNK